MRIIKAASEMQGRNIWGLDFKQAYLNNAKLSEGIRWPELLGGEVVKACSVIYGLKRSGLAWKEGISEKLPSDSARHEDTQSASQLSSFCSGLRPLHSPFVLLTGMSKSRYPHTLRWSRKGCVLIRVCMQESDNVCDDRGAMQRLFLRSYPRSSATLSFRSS